MSRTLADIIGEAAHGRPAAVKHTASSLSSFADDLLTGRRQLADARKVLWEGEASEKFQTAVDDKLLPNLDKLHHSYALAAKALAGYAKVLGEVRTDGRALLQRINALDELQREAEAALQSRQAELHTAQLSHNPVAGLSDPAEHARSAQQLEHAQSAVATATSTVTMARDAVAEIEQKAAHLRDHHHSAERRAAGLIEDAEAVGLTDGLFADLVDTYRDMGPVASQVGEFVKHVGEEAGTDLLIATVIAIAASAAVATGGAAAPAEAVAAESVLDVLLAREAAATPKAIARLATATGRAGTAARVGALAERGGAAADPKNEESTAEWMSAAEQAAVDDFALPFVIKKGAQRVVSKPITVPVARQVDRTQRRGVSTPNKRTYVNHDRREVLVEVDGGATEQMLKLVVEPGEGRDAAVTHAPSGGSARLGSPTGPAGPTGTTGSAGPAQCTPGG